MKQKKTGKILITLLMGIACFLSILFTHSKTLWAAEPRFKVSVNPNPVREDDNLQLRMEIVTENAERISKPTFTANAFDILGSGTSSSVSSQYINGKITAIQNSIFTFILYPKAAGEQKITDLQVQVGNTLLSASDVKITVLSAGSNLPTPSNQDDDENSNPARPQNFSSSTRSAGAHPTHLNSDFTVHLSLSKKIAYPGEPIVAEYYIYDFGSLQNIEIQKWPSFPGFYKEDLEIVPRFQFESVYVNNQKARRALVARFAIYAYKPGKFTLDRLVINGQYFIRSLQPQNDDDDPFASFFFGSIGQRRKGSHASEEETIEILPLPENNRPADFGGAVGKFQINLNTDKQQVAANSPINLSLIIQGSGNFHNIGEMKLPLPPDFELYESNTAAKASAPIGSSRSLENTKTFQYLILPRKEGKYTIPSIPFSYFDPEKKSYQTARTKEVALDITKDEGTHYTNSNLLSNQNTDQSPNIKAANDLNYLKSANSILNNKPDYLQIVLSILSLLFGILSIIFGFLVLRGKFSTTSLFPHLGNAKKKRAQTLYNQLKKAEPNNTNYYATLEKSIHGLLELILEKSSLGITLDELEQEWKERKFPATAFFALKTLWEKCDKARFAGNKNTTIEKQVLAENLEEFKKIIVALELI